MVILGCAKTEPKYSVVRLSHEGRLQPGQSRTQESRTQDSQKEGEHHRVTADRGTDGGGAADLGAVDPDAVDVRNGYVALVPADLIDALPCSLAVARVADDGDDDTNDNPGSLAMAPANELVAWLELFADAWSISEVVPVTYPIYQNRSLTTGALLEQAAELGAGLCLIYHESIYPDIATEIRGTIFDVQSGGALARIHADAAALPEGVEIPPPADRIEIDRRHVDPVFVARACFRESVRECVMEWVTRFERGGGHGGPPMQTVDTQKEANRPVRLSSDRNK